MVNIKYLFLIVLFSISLSNLSFTQGNDETLKALGDSLLAQGHHFFSKENKLDSAIIMIAKSSECYKKGKAWKNYISALNDISYIYYEYKKYSKFDAAAQLAYQESKKYLKLKDEPRIRALGHLSVYYYTLGDFDKSVEIYKETLELSLKNNTPKKEMANAYLNLANVVKFSGDTDNALSLYNKALNIARDTFENEPIMSNYHTHIAGVFQLYDQLDSTIFHYKKAAYFLAPITHKDSKGFINRKIKNFLFLAQVLNQKGDYQLATHYIDKALQFQLTPLQEVIYQETRGKLFYAQGKFNNAIMAFQKGQNIANEFKVNNLPLPKARRLINLANCYKSINDFKTTLNTYQFALQTLSPNFKSDNYQDNPKVQELLDKPDALIILNEKASILFQLYAINKEINYLKAAYDTYIKATDLIGDIRQGIITIESKKTLSEKAVPIYEGAIRTALDLSVLTDNKDYKTAAFTLAESNKALLLLESINEQSAKGFAGIPDSLLEQEKGFKLQLTFLQKSLLNDKAKGKNDKNIADQIFDFQQKLDRLTSHFEKEYPRYFELKYQNEPIDLKIIQSILAKNNTALLEYFVGEEAIYLFILTSNGLDIQTIENPDLAFAAIQKLRPTLSQAPGADAVSEFERFTSNAHELYALLLQSGLEKIPESITGLTIIPDDQLNYIPFSILLTKPANPKNPGYSISDLEYLMEKYPVNYHYSATLLHKSQQRKKVAFENDFIGFAPSFKANKSIASRACTSDELYSLQCSEEEVNSISNLFDGMAYTNQSATKSAFEQIASSNQIIHLATHACVDEQDANFNKIFLTDDFLSNYDLYNLELNAELAVLSACNTGSGELVKGEGVMSLARGFINAGCSSTLMSMWSVDDCATSEIMIGFYKNLKTGMKKDEALQAAKFSFINAASKTKRHPYYWAAFVPFGDMDAIEIRSSNNWWFYILGLSLLLGAFIFWKKSQSKKLF